MLMVIAVKMVKIADTKQKWNNSSSDNNHLDIFPATAFVISVRLKLSRGIFRPSIRKESFTFFIDPQT